MRKYFTLEQFREIEKETNTTFSALDGTIPLEVLLACEDPLIAIVGEDELCIKADNKDN